MLRKSVFVAAILLTAGVVLAQSEPAAEEESPWSGSASLGYLSTSGNTETTSFNTSVGVGYAMNAWKHALTAKALGSDQNEISTAEAYQVGWQSDYNLTEKDFIFGTVDWRKDRFSGVDEQTTETVGYGRRLLETSNHLLNVGLGVGHRSADLSDGTSESGVIGRASLDYNWIITETSGFDQNIVIESGSDNTYIESVSALRARLIGDFALVVSYTIKQNSDVPVGTQKTDRLSAISVEYVF
jgi:putative salt-induced outer membrane protein